ncbi:hypothetical protein TNCV_4151131 [Trichonephila clavipes]|nr:hypothetical protein TNCV_4151131 [Trichonephila clavipes]
MDDNTTCHRTLAVQDCLDSESIQRLVWPAPSPDLNPIENVWDALGRKLEVGGSSTSRTTMLERSTCTLHCCRNGSDCVETRLQGPAVLVKLPDDWAYHHHLSVIFFVESSSCTHTNCNRAMNFLQQIPHRGKRLRSGRSLKWNRTWVLTSCGQIHFSVMVLTITVPFGRPLIHVSTHRSHCIPQKDSMVWFHGFIYHITLL